MNISSTIPIQCWLLQITWHMCTHLLLSEMLTLCLIDTVMVACLWRWWFYACTVVLSIIGVCTYGLAVRGFVEAHRDLLELLFNWRRNIAVVLFATAVPLYVWHHEQCLGTRLEIALHWQCKIAIIIAITYNNCKWVNGWGWGDNNKRGKQFHTTENK